MKERLGREYFEELYENSPDPWNFETSEYERKKYRHTLYRLGERKFRRALEVGCSIGVFTEMLAPRCGELLAVDASDRAVSAARNRLEKIPNVRVERRTLPEEAPEGTFDLIVASEVLYYLDLETMLEMLRLLESSLAPGGLFLAVHWRKETKTYPLQGDEVHDLIRSNTRLDHIKSEAEPEYRLDLFTRESGGAPLRETRHRHVSTGVGSRERHGGETFSAEASGRIRRESGGREGETIEEKRVESIPTPETSEAEGGSRGGASASRSERQRAAPDSRRAEPKAAKTDTERS